MIYEYYRRQRLGKGLKRDVYTGETQNDGASFALKSHLEIYGIPEHSFSVIWLFCKSTFLVTKR